MLEFEPTHKNDVSRFPKREATCARHNHDAIALLLVIGVVFNLDPDEFTKQQ